MWQTLLVWSGMSPSYYLLSCLVSITVVMVTWFVGRKKKQKSTTEEGGEEDEDHRTSSQPLEKDQLLDELKEIPDLVEFAHHIPAAVKSAQHRVATRKIVEDMTERQRDEEREAQAKQMAAIYQIIQQEEETFGLTSLDDVKAQLKLYVP